MWQIIVENVGDDPLPDARGVYADSWRELRDRFAAEADSMIESDRWTALFIADPSRMGDKLERCIAADELWPASAHFAQVRDLVLLVRILRLNLPPRVGLVVRQNDHLEAHAVARGDWEDAILELLHSLAGAIAARR